MILEARPIEWQLIPPDKATGEQCDSITLGGKFLLPSGRVIYFNPSHLKNNYRFAFEIVEGNEVTPGKLAHIKNNIIDGCRRPARYWTVENDGNDQDEADKIRKACGVCSGKEDYPSDLPVLTIEMLEKEADGTYVPEWNTFI
jgi:hypothetical protein